MAAPGCGVEGVRLISLYSLATSIAKLLPPAWRTLQPLVVRNSWVTCRRVLFVLQHQNGLRTVPLAPARHLQTDLRLPTFRQG
jgi:hypothetical protein